jgi:hypothetical protein
MRKGDRVMDDRNLRDSPKREDDRDGVAARDFDTSAAPWITGILLLAIIAFGVIFFGPWEKPEQTTSTPAVTTPAAGTTGTLTSPDGVVRD